MSTKSLSRDFECQCLRSHAGMRYVLGVDEAGRGPLAGPVVIASCIVEARVEIDGIQEFEQQRQRLICIYGSRRRSLTLLMRSIQLVTVVILLTAIDVIVLFISTVTPLNLSGFVLPIFAIAMVCLICSSLLFLKELSIASKEFHVDFD